MVETCLSYSTWKIFTSVPFVLGKNILSSVIRFGVVFMAFKIKLIDWCICPCSSNYWVLY